MNLCISVKDCNHPDKPGNGSVLISSTKYKGRATYACDVGFVMVGDLVRICTENGTWNGTAPVCNCIVLIYTILWKFTTLGVIKHDIVCCML